MLWYTVIFIVIYNAEAVSKCDVAVDGAWRERGDVKGRL